MSSLTFKHLNIDWNAEPNAPEPEVTVRETGVQLTFLLNPWAYEAYEGQEGCLIFEHCSMWRLGATNDHGWYAGQCRYSKTAPKWGEFYELLGNDELQPLPTDWQILSQPTSQDRHFLFYLRDETFECFASDWMFKRGSACMEFRQDQPA